MLVMPFTDLGNLLIDCSTSVYCKQWITYKYKDGNFQEPRISSNHSDMAPFTSLPVDTATVAQYFITLPVRTCESEAFATIQRALRSTIYSCTAPGTKEQRKAKYRHTNPAGNLFALCLPLCDADRLGYAVQLIEFLCIVDG